MDQWKQKEFQKLVKEVTPTHNLGLQMLKAFLVGGAICTLGQFILNMAQNNFGLDKEAAGSWCSLILVLLSVLLTGLNIYPRIAKWGGAGAAVPLTGFGSNLAKGVAKAISEKGALGILTGGLTATAGGIAAAVVCGFLAALVFRPGEKR